MKSGGQFAYTEKGRLAPHILQQGESELVFCDEGHECYKTSSGEVGPILDINLTCDWHVPRKFIWEFNLTCGCHMECRNKVVQLGMKVKVGVFWTGEKGWGVRTFEPIPIGTFVFEYVGEVCTNAEVIIWHDKSSIHGWYTLDLNANSETQAGVNDNKALCIDGFKFGNVARFVNHRCEDANLMDYPVRIESRDPHIYHVVFFAKRHIYALEELTWDYGTAFWDAPGSAPCSCGSKLCRGKKMMRYLVPPQIPYRKFSCSRKLFGHKGA